jgi:hypothetical protein
VSYEPGLELLADGVKRKAHHADDREHQDKYGDDDEGRPQAVREGDRHKHCHGQDEVTPRQHQTAVGSVAASLITIRQIIGVADNTA